MTRFAAVLALAAATCAMPADAALYRFSVSLFDPSGNPIHDSGGQLFADYAFLIDSDPTPDLVSSDPTFPFFTINDVTITHYALNLPFTATTTDNLTFWDGSVGGAFANADYSINFFGLPLYSGTVDQPHFERGLYDLYVPDANDPAGRVAGTLTIAAVPEPASWMMMVGGFALAGVALRRRTTNVSFA